MKKRNRKRLAYVLAAAMIISLGAGLPSVPSMADTENVQATSEQELEVYSLDANNKDKQGVIYKLDTKFMTAKAIGQEILDEGEIRIPDFVEKDGVRYAVKEVVFDAFANCELITSLHVSDTVEKFAFRSLGASSCKKLFLGAGVKEVDYFCEKMELQEIQVAEENPYYIAEDGVLYDKNKTKLFRFPPKKMVTGPIELPESVKVIGNYAFAAVNLTDIDLSHITYIESFAFDSCKYLQKADLRSCRHIEQHAFDFCQSLKYVRFRPNVEVDKQAFYTVGLKVGWVPFGGKGIPSADLNAESEVFSSANNCIIYEGSAYSSSNMYQFNLEKAAISDGVTKINENIMTDNKIRKLYIPPSVTEFMIGVHIAEWNGTIYGSKGSAAETFAEKKGKKFVAHEASEHHWENGTYWEDDTVHIKGDICDVCGTVKNVSYLWGDETEEPERAEDLVYELDENNKDVQGITYVLYEARSGTDQYEHATAGSGAAEVCHAEHVIIPDFVKKNGKMYPVKSIDINVVGEETRQVTIGEWVDNIYKDTFSACTNLETISVDENNTSYCGDNGILFNKQKTRICYFSPIRTGSYEIPSSVHTIGEKAFYYSNLSEVTLPEHDVEIEKYAFSKSKITTMDASHVTNIENYAFTGCSQLRWVACGNRLRFAGSLVFSQCVRLEAVYMPKVADLQNGVTSICDGCFNLAFLYFPAGVTDIDIGSSVGKLQSLYVSSISSISRIYADFDKDKLTVYGDADMKTLFENKGYTFSSYCKGEHHLSDYVISTYEGRSLEGRRCETCGYLTGVHVVTDGKPGEDITGPSPTPSPTPKVTPSPSPSPTPTFESEGTPSPTPGKPAGVLSNPRTDRDGVVTWDCVYFGNYWQSDTNGDEKADKNDVRQPIKWRVLSVDGDDAFLLADMNVDVKNYNDRYVATWETCTMRSWLNGYGASSNVCEKDYISDNFLDNAFSASEQAAIKTTTVVNEDNPKHGTVGGNNTNDKVYLLSIGEVMNPLYGFSSDDDTSKTRVSVNTEYVAARTKSVHRWWLRSPGCNTSSAAVINDNGYVFSSGIAANLNYDGCTVRPALHLNLSSGGWGKAGTVNSLGVITTPIPSPSPSPSPSPTPEATPSPSPTPEATPSPSPSPTPRVTPSPSPSSTPRVTPSPSPASRLTPKVTSNPKHTKKPVISQKVKKKRKYLSVRPVITLKKKKKAGVRYLQVNLKKYKGKYIQVYVKVGKKPFKKISSKKILIKKHKRRFKIRYFRRKQKIKIKVRTYNIKKKKKIYSRYSKTKKIVT